MEYFKLFMEMSSALFFCVAAFSLRQAEKTMRDSNLKILHNNLSIERELKEHAQESYVQLLKLHKDMQDKYDRETKILKDMVNAKDNKIMELENKQYTIYAGVSDPIDTPITKTKKRGKSK